MANNPFDPQIIQVKKTLERGGMAGANRGFGSVRGSSPSSRPAPGPQTIDELDDVDTTDIEDGQALLWSESEGLFLPGDAGSGGGGGGGGGPVVAAKGRDTTGGVFSPTPAASTITPNSPTVTVQANAGQVLLITYAAYLSKGSSGDRIRVKARVNGTDVFPDSGGYSISQEGTQQQVHWTVRYVVTATGPQTVEFWGAAALGTSSTTFNRQQSNVQVLDESISGGGGSGGWLVKDYTEANTQVSLSASGTIWTRTITAAPVGTYMLQGTYWSWSGGGYGTIRFRKDGVNLAGGGSDPGRQAMPCERTVMALCPHNGGDLVLDLHFAREAGTIQFGTAGDARFGRHVHVLGPV